MPMPTQCQTDAIWTSNMRNTNQTRQNQIEQPNNPTKAKLEIHVPLCTAVTL